MTLATPLAARRSRRGPRIQQTVAFVVLWLSAIVAVLPVLGVAVVMILRAYSSLNLEVLRGISDWLLPSAVGTVLLVALTTLISAPLGVAAAVYLSEYARHGPLVRIIRLALVNLAGVPSVVYGLFGLALFVVLMKMDRSLLAGACTLALLVLPLVISASEEALRQVPQSLRAASLGLGATQWQTVRRVVLPNATPGILTGLILAIGRAAGETAPIMFTCAVISKTHPYPILMGPDGFRPFAWLLEGTFALPFQLYYICTEKPGVEPSEKWATALVLLGLVLAMNMAAVVMRARMRRGRRW